MSFFIFGNMHPIIILFGLLSLVSANNWATYPQVPKTASINGFADPIIDDLPDCATDCVKPSTGNTPCPYWDTGCLCVMPQWAGMVAQCIAEKCKEKDVVSATSLAYSLCSSVGANVWLMPASITEALVSAAGTANEAAPSASDNEWNYLLTTGKDDAKTTSSKTTKLETTLESKNSDLEQDKSDESKATLSKESSLDEDTSSSQGLGMKLSGGVVSLVLGSLFSLLL